MSTQIDTDRICFDRLLPDDVERLGAAERSTRSPQAKARLRMAILMGKKWQQGKTIKVSFLDGEQSVRDRVQAIAKEWENYANLSLDFGDHSDAEIRISFLMSGSWSYLGVDANGIPDSEPTMNYGWLTPDTEETEYRRVVLHEFGHALGAIHEHQNPAGGIPWDKEAVYERYTGPPNNWSRDQVDQNLFRRYEADITQFTEFDPDSIMLYAIANDLTEGDWEVGWNTELSESDKQFMAQMYPQGVNNATALPVDGTQQAGTIGAHGTSDIYAFDVVTAGTYTVETQGDQDLVVSLAGPDSEDAMIGQDDDSGADGNARLSMPLAAGRYYATVRHYWPAEGGTYSISVTEG